MERYTMLLDWKNQYCQNNYTIQSNLQIQCNTHQITNGILHRIRTKNLQYAVVVQSLSCVWFFAIPWIVAHKAPLSMGFPRQEYWSGLPFSRVTIPWVTFSRGSSWTRDWSCISCTDRQILYHWATKEAHTRSGGGGVLKSGNGGKKCEVFSFPEMDNYYNWLNEHNHKMLSGLCTKSGK